LDTACFSQVFQQIFSKKTITVYKPGTQIRDINYVDDVVKALILSMVYPTTDGKIYNLDYNKGTINQILEAGNAPKDPIFPR